MKLSNKIKFYFATLLILSIPALSRAADDELKIIQDAAANAPVSAAQTLIKADNEGLVQVPVVANNDAYIDPVKYTLGAEDTVEITVMRHPEFSGIYPVNLEGKIQYKFVGDIDVTGLTKKLLEKKVADVISMYVISPEVNVTITEYKSKVIYILGEVGQPGKFYMQSESIPVREAVVRAGLPTLSAAMRRCRIITPSKDGKGKIKKVDLYAILYGGNLKNNLEMRPGDILYVPSTVMTKIIRMINPVASTVGLASSGPSDMSAGKAAVKTLAK